MLRLLAIIMLAFAVCFYAWNVVHGVWSYRMFFMLGMLAWCISDRWDRAL
jgi:hypothetical protein